MRRIATATAMGRHSATRTVTMAVGIGVITGVTARALMRLVALTALNTPGFSVAGTSLIVVLFCLSSIGAALAGRAHWRLPWRLLLAAASSFLLVYTGVVIGAQEISSALDKPLGPARWMALVALTVSLAAVTFGSVITCWRLGARPIVAGAAATPCD